MIRLNSLVLSSMLWFLVPSIAIAQYPVAVGERHPDFELPNIDGGDPIQLSDYRGQKVLLVHFASW